VIDEQSMRPALISLILAAGILSAAEFPEAAISNGLIQATLRLPDPQRGYYRGTRFDWSGAIWSLQYKGHEYFGQWFENYDPKTHDAITGPVEEFRTSEAGLGYAEARPGGTFIRIGVGVVRKPEEPQYRPFNTYEIVNNGKWTVHKAADHVEFIHRLESAGYGYEYRKVVRLAKDKPQLVLEHILKNTGKRTIETAVYDHNFFVIDGTPTGPEFTVKFPFEPQAKRDLKDMAEVKATQLAYRRDLEKGESVFTELEGFGKTAADYDIHIENHKAGAGVHIVGDHPLVKLVYWSIRTTLCPEPYIQMKIDPGQESKWKITYDFYVTK
jgi:hypothetical protein